MWLFSMFLDEVITLSYQTGTIPGSVYLIWVWSKTFFVWGNSEFTKLIQTKSNQSNQNVPIFNVLGWSCNFVIANWYYPWVGILKMSLIGNIICFEGILSLQSRSRQSRSRPIKMWLLSIFLDEAVTLSYQTGTITGSVYLI